MNNESLFTGCLPNTLSQEELYSYFEKMKSGDKRAREIIITHNIKLVLYRIEKRFNDVPYDKQELASVGLIGLINSVDNFDTSKQLQFSTYAIKCIDNAILRFLSNSEMDLYVDSINRPIRADTDGRELRLEDILVDKNEDIVSNYERKETISIIKRIVDELPERDKEIVTLYFGFIGDRRFSILEIANCLGISRQYVLILLKQILKNIKERLIKEGILPQNCTKEKVTKYSRTKKPSLRLPSIYEYFKDYTKEEIDDAISKLTDKEKELIHLRYGEDLDNPTTSPNWTKEAHMEFYKHLIPKMRVLLIDPIRKPKGKTIYEYFSDYTKSEVDEVIAMLTDEERELMTLKYGKNLDTYIAKPGWTPEMSYKFSGLLRPKMKRLLLKLRRNKLNQEDNTPSPAIPSDDIDFISTPGFKRYISSLAPRDSLIIILKYGLRGKSFSVESISEYLMIEEEEVRETIKRVLLGYKEQLSKGEKELDNHSYCIQPIDNN